MHPRRSAQDVLLCDLCETAPLQSHCDICNVSLCRPCVGEHLSDFKLHNVVPFSQHVQTKSTPNYPKCQKHARKNCERHCEKCDTPVCSTCIYSGKHKGHDISDISGKFSSKIRNLLYDLKELETKIYPRYEEMASDIQNEKAKLEMNYRKLVTTAHQQGEVLFREVTTIVNQRKSDIEEMKNKHLSTLYRNEDETTQNIIALKKIIADLKLILKSNDVSLTSTYKSRNSEFRTFPPKVRATIPFISPQIVNKDQLNEMLGSLSSLSMYTEHNYTTKSPEAASPPVKPLTSAEAESPIVQPFHDKPRLIATIETGFKEIFSVTCLNEENIWTCGNNKMMKLFNLHGKLLTSIKTKSGITPRDIAVTRDGGLIYTDFINRTVNLVKSREIRTVITLKGWKPLYVYSAASDDLLVTMIKDDNKQSKVFRYSGSTEKQTIQFDDQGCPLYSSGSFIFNEKYISENRNLDICVADREARAVVVVNQSGKLQFRYYGRPSETKEIFDPRGITTDSHGQILTAANDRIHILDQDGQFLRYIQNCHLRAPFGVCVSTRDILFVADFETAQVKKIKYV